MGLFVYVVVRERERERERERDSQAQQPGERLYMRQATPDSPAIWQ